MHVSLQHTHTESLNKAYLDLPSQLGHSMSNQNLSYTASTQILMKLYTYCSRDPNTCKRNPLFFKLTTYFHNSGTFAFYENVNLRVSGLFKNPHCTKYMSHRTNYNMYSERKLYRVPNLSSNLRLEHFYRVDLFTLNFAQSVYFDVFLNFCQRKVQDFTKTLYKK